MSFVSAISPHRLGNQTETYSGFKLSIWHRHFLRFSTSLMQCNLHLLLDQLTQKEGKQFLVVGSLMNIFTETLRSNTY